MTTLTEKEIILKVLKDYREEIENEKRKHDLKTYQMYLKGQLSMINIIISFIDIVL